MSEQIHYGRLPPEDDGTPPVVIVFIGLLIVAIIVSLIFIALHFTCTWSLFDTTQCLCEKHGGSWDESKSPKCTIGSNTSPQKCTQVCLNGTQLADCTCKCDYGWTGDACQIFIPNTQNPPTGGGTGTGTGTTGTDTGTTGTDTGTTGTDTGTTGTGTTGTETTGTGTTGTGTTGTGTTLLQYPISGTSYMIKAPTSDLYFKTVGGSAIGNNQKLDDCKGNPANCQWVFNPVSGAGNVYNIKASDADLYLRNGGGVIWLANNSWVADPSTQYELLKGDMTDSFYFRPVSSTAKYVAVKGDWKQDAVPSVMSCTPGVSGGTPGCQWSLQKMGE